MGPWTAPECIPGMNSAHVSKAGAVNPSGSERAARLICWASLKRTFAYCANLKHTNLAELDTLLLLQDASSKPDKIQNRLVFAMPSRPRHKGFVLGGEVTSPCWAF